MMTLIQPKVSHLTIHDDNDEEIRLMMMLGYCLLTELPKIEGMKDFYIMIYYNESLFIRPAKLTFFRI